MNSALRQIVFATCLTGLVAALVMPVEAARAPIGSIPPVVVVTPKPVTSSP